jgi:TubC N-terminal docking domain
MNNLSELMESLARQNIHLKIDDGKLNIRAPKGALTPELRAQLSDYKPELLAYLQAQSLQANQDGVSDLSTLGRLIGGASETLEDKPPVIDPQVMAQQLRVTFRSVSNLEVSQEVLIFRDELAEALKKQGVTVEPWENATIDFRSTLTVPLLGWKRTFTTRVVRKGIDAVIDVERPVSALRRLGIFASEALYAAYINFWKGDRAISVSRIATLSSWAEDHAVRYIEDPTNTQVIVLTDFDPQFADPDLPYQEKIGLGINTLVRTFAEIVIGVSPARIFLLNMNLSDAVFERHEIDRFVGNSLIPKVFVPIFPLSMSRFVVGRFAPQDSPYALRLRTLGQAVGETGLLPPGSKFTDVIQRRSHRDIVNVLVNGRTGVSYGFVAYAEPPRYVGALEISGEGWEKLEVIPGFSPELVRQNSEGRWYMQIDRSGQSRFRQIPDLYIVSARSGSNKTNLSLETDIVRIGLKKGQLHLDLPEGIDPQKTDIKPSYDVYVMLGIALSASLYAPQLISEGASMVHFHGFPAPQWFAPGEHWVGEHNPSVPCGTYESGIFNLLGLEQLATQHGDSLRLACLIEPDHGTNLIAADTDYLIARLKAGCKMGQIHLGGKHYRSLWAAEAENGRQVASVVGDS